MTNQHPHLTDNLGASETLTLCFQALLAQHGTETGYAAVNSALGLSFATAASDRGPGPMEWLGLARDARLHAAGDVFGLRMRDLHPVAASSGVDKLPEFGQHFVDSYLPLIRRALQHGQSVLARGGWPGDRCYEWGLITAEADDGLGVVGQVAGSEVAMPLVGPASQCYVIEEAMPREPEFDDLLKVALVSAEVLLGDRAEGPVGMVCGPGAYEVWRRRLLEDMQCTGMDSPSIEAHVMFTRQLIADREAGALFLGEACDRLTGVAAERAREAKAECAATAEAIQSLRVCLTGMPEGKSDENEEALVAALRQAAEADERLHDCLAALAGAIG